MADPVSGDGGSGEWNEGVDPGTEAVPSVTGDDYTGGVDEANVSSESASAGASAEHDDRGSGMSDWTDAQASAGGDTGGDAGRSDLRSLFGDDAEINTGYIPPGIMGVDPSAMISGMVFGQGYARVDEEGADGDSESVECVIVSLTADCLECDDRHPLGPLTLMLPMDLAKFTRKALGQIIDKTINVEADKWMDGELERIVGEMRDDEG